MYEKQYLLNKILEWSSVKTDRPLKRVSFEYRKHTEYRNIQHIYIDFLERLACKAICMCVYELYH